MTVATVNDMSLKDAAAIAGVTVTVHLIDVN